MPFTPFHLGPALLVGLLAARWVDLPTLLAGSVVVDVRAVVVVFGPLGGPVHGPLTTLAGGAVVAGVLAAATYPVRPAADPLLDRLGLAQHRSAGRVALGALAGTWSHVLLDATLYGDVQPFAPASPANPLLGVASLPAVYFGCVTAGALGIALYGVHRLGGGLPGFAGD